MGSIPVVAREQPGPRAGWVEHREVRLGDFVDGEGEGLSGGPWRLVNFYWDRSCETVQGLGSVEIVEDMGTRRG